NCCDPPVTTVGLAGEIVILGGGSGLIVTMARPALVESPCKTAATVTIRGLGTLAGAAYEAVAAPEVVIVPTKELPPGIPFTCQVTKEFGAFSTVTKNWTLAPAAICAEAGERVMLTLGVRSTLLLMGVPPPPPPAQEICWVMAMSASHLAIERILERGNRLRTSGEESQIAR